MHCTGRRIERSRHISLLNPTQKTSRYSTRKQIISADGSIVETEAPTKKLKDKLFFELLETITLFFRRNVLIPSFQQIYISS